VALLTLVTLGLLDQFQIDSTVRVHVRLAKLVGYFGASTPSWGSGGAGGFAIPASRSASGSRAKSSFRSSAINILLQSISRSFRSRASARARSP
jgi:hypothetical protein